MEREQARLRTNLRGHESHHLTDTRVESNVRHLRGRNVPIPIPPVLDEGSGTGHRPNETFDPRRPDQPQPTDPPPPPQLPPPLRPPEIDKQEDSTIVIPTPNIQNKPNIPPKPVAPRTCSRMNSDTPHGVSSEMESDDYHGVSRLLAKGAEKINKNKLALELQDKNRVSSYLSESEEDTSSRTPRAVRPYDDGEVSLKAVIPPDSTSSGSGSPPEEVYLTPTQTGKQPNQSGLKYPLPSPTGQQYINEKLRQWPGAGTYTDGCYYSYKNREVANAKPLNDAIIFHPLVREFVRVKGQNVSVIARMPISLDQLVIFERFDCYSCYDPVADKVATEDLTWDSFQSLHPESEPGRETPQYMTVNNPQQTVQQSDSPSAKTEPHLNSFGTSVDLTINYSREPPGEDSIVERLLGNKAHIQDQLRDLSGESNDDERNLPKTLGEHQMQFLPHLQSIRDAQVYQGRAKSNPAPTLSQIEGSETSQGSEPRTHSGGSSLSSILDSDVNQPVRFQQVARLKEIMEMNLRVLQDQINWNHSKMHEEEPMKSQGTSMTPIGKIERGTNTNLSPLENSPTPQEQTGCRHCGSISIKDCRCAYLKEMREREINWLQYQEALLESCNLQKKRARRINCLNCYSADHNTYECPEEADRKKRIVFGLQLQEALYNSLKNTDGPTIPVGLDPHKVEAIAMARKLANPSGRKWDPIEKKRPFPLKEVNTREVTHSESTPRPTRDQLSRPSGDPRSEYMAFNNNETPGQYSHAKTTKQTDNTYGDLINRDNTPANGSQVPFNQDLRAEQISQVPLKEMNYPHENPTYNNKDFLTPYANNSNQFVTPLGEKATIDDRANKRNVHFWDQEEYTPRSHKQKGHDPILITPCHPPTEPTRDSIDRSDPYQNIPSMGESTKPGGKYFSGTVENGQGGNFHGYYFYPLNLTPSLRDPPTTNPIRHTSTPYDPNGPNEYGLTPSGSRPPGESLPRTLFPTPRHVPKRERVSGEGYDGKYGPEVSERGSYCSGERLNKHLTSPPPNHVFHYHVKGHPTHNHPIPPGYPPQRGLEHLPPKGKGNERSFHPRALRGNYVKQEDEDGYPLPEFDGPPSMDTDCRKPPSMDTDCRKPPRLRPMKPEPELTDSDQGSEVDQETHAQTSLGYSSNGIRTPSSVSSVRRGAGDTSLASSQVGDVLSQLLNHQKVLQDKNLEVMNNLVNRSTNSFVLDDIPVFDGLRGSVDYETWLLELDKAVEITGMSMMELAFSKSSGTPHKMIKRLRREKSWEFIKEKLQITYAKLATDVHASTDLNLNKQKRHEPLEDYIERFYQNYK